MYVHAHSTTGDDNSLVAVRFWIKKDICTKVCDLKILPHIDNTSHLTVFLVWDSSPHLPVTLAQLMGPGIGQNVHATHPMWDLYTNQLLFFIETCSSVCIQHNTWKWKSAKNGESLGEGLGTLIRWHGRKVDVGGQCPTTNTCTRTWERVSHLSSRVLAILWTSGVLPSDRVLNDVYVV